MKRLMQLVLLSIGLLATGLTLAAGEWVGQDAPAFHLQDQNSQWHELKDYHGQWVALYFYPKDGTPGCTEEAKKFRDRFPDFQKQKIVVLGVSLDDVASHKAFSDQLGLPFAILADTDRSLARQFNVLKGFGPLVYAKRETFLIDPEGTIVYHYPSVDTVTHADQVLKDVARLSQKP